MNVTNLGLSWNSRYLELSPTEMAIAIVAALLVGGAALYFLLKVLRSKPVKLLGMALLIAGIALVASCAPASAPPALPVSVAPAASSSNAFRKSTPATCDINPAN